MDPKVFNAFRKLIYDKSGINLNEGKIALVSARISKRMRTLGMDDAKLYLNQVRKDTSGEEIIQLLYNHLGVEVIIKYIKIVVRNLPARI